MASGRIAARSGHYRRPWRGSSSTACGAAGVAGGLMNQPERGGSADYVDPFMVFNIGGNKYRLIAVIHYNRRKVYIRQVLTHAEYDRDKWKRRN